MSDLGDRIKAARESHGWSLTELADEAGVSKGYLSQLENADSNPSIKVLRRVAQALDVRVSDLIGDSSPAEEAGTRYRVTFNVTGRSLVEVRAMDEAEARQLAWDQLRSEPHESDWDIIEVIDLDEEAKARGAWTDEAYRSVRSDGVLVFAGRDFVKWAVAGSDNGRLCFPGTHRAGWWSSRERAKREADIQIPVRG